MPYSLEHLLIYGIVALVLILFARRLWCGIRASGKCGRDCSCGKGEIRRDPVISAYLKRSGPGKPEDSSKR